MKSRRRPELSLYQLFPGSLSDHETYRAIQPMMSLRALVAADMGMKRRWMPISCLLTVAGNETTRFLNDGWTWRNCSRDSPRTFARVATGSFAGRSADDRRHVPVRFARHTYAAHNGCKHLELHGDAIALRATKVVLWFASANHDEKQFSGSRAIGDCRPQAPNAHLGFGLGAHFCVGAHLARAGNATVLRTPCLRSR